MDLPPEPQFVSIGDIEVFVARQHPPIWTTYCAHAELVDEQAATDRDADLLVAGIRHDDRKWPGLLLSLAYTPSHGGFAPGILVVPESHVAFVGAGTTLRAYLLSPDVQVLWRDVAEVGFWGWRRHGSTVVMSAELEVAAWDIDGTKLWSRFVEPPWSYTVEGHLLTLDVMGNVTAFDLRSGS